MKPIYIRDLLKIFKNLDSKAFNIQKIRKIEDLLVILSRFVFNRNIYMPQVNNNLLTKFYMDFFYRTLDCHLNAHGFR